MTVRAPVEVGKMGFGPAILASLCGQLIPRADVASIARPADKRGKSISRLHSASRCG